MSLFRPYELTSTSTPTTPSVTATSGGPPVPAAPPTTGPLGSATSGGHPAADLSGANMQMAMFLAAHTAAAAARAAEMELLRHQSGSSPLNPQVGVLLSNFDSPHQRSGAHLPLFFVLPNSKRISFILGSQQSTHFRPWLSTSKPPSSGRQSQYHPYRRGSTTGKVDE